MPHTIHYIEDKIYKCKHYFFIGDFRELQEWSKKSFDFEISSHLSRHAGFCVGIGRDGCQIHILWMPEFKITPEHIAVVAHELSHAAVRKITTIGDNYDINPKNDEHFCYYLSFLIREFLASVMEKDKENEQDKE